MSVGDTIVSGDAGQYSVRAQINVLSSHSNFKYPTSFAVISPPTPSTDIGAMGLMS